MIMPTTIPFASETSATFAMIVGPTQAAIVLEVGYILGGQVHVLVRPREVLAVMIVPGTVEENLAHR